LAFIQFNQGLLVDGRDTYQKVLLQSPDGKEAHYGIGAVAATRVGNARKQARENAQLSADALGPIPDAALRAALQKQQGPVSDEGMQHLQTVLRQDPNFAPAMAYMSQLIRARANYAADAEGYKKEIVQAQEWEAKLPKSAANSAPVPKQIRVEVMCRRRSFCAKCPGRSLSHYKAN
jgi:hypothetical protein